MDSDNDSYHFPKCQTHAYTRFENGCSENSTQKLLTNYYTEENNKHVICRPRSVRIGENCVLGLVYGPWPAASGRTEDLWHGFSQYGPPGRQITYTSETIDLAVIAIFERNTGLDLKLSKLNLGTF